MTGSRKKVYILFAMAIIIGLGFLCYEMTGKQDKAMKGTFVMQDKQKYIQLI